MGGKNSQLLTETRNRRLGKRLYRVIGRGLDRGFMVVGQKYSSGLGRDFPRVL